MREFSLTVQHYVFSEVLIITMLKLGFKFCNLQVTLVKFGLYGVAFVS